MSDSKKSEVQRDSLSPLERIGTNAPDDRIKSSDLTKHGHPSLFQDDVPKNNGNEFLQFRSSFNTSNTTGANGGGLMVPTMLLLTNRESRQITQTTFRSRTVI